MVRLLYRQRSPTGEMRQGQARRCNTTIARLRGEAERVGLKVAMPAPQGALAQAGLDDPARPYPIIPYTRVLRLRTYEGSACVKLYLGSPYKSVCP